MDIQDGLANVAYVLDGIPNASKTDYALAYKYLAKRDALDIAEILGCNV
jgi:hypothetical protein